MIKINLYNKAIMIVGHANYKECGNDIYCAAISAISQSSINWFDDGDIELKIESGLFKLKILNDNKENLYKLSLLKKQLLSFKDNQFKNYIIVNKNRKDYYE